MNADILFEAVYMTTRVEDMYGNVVQKTSRMVQLRTNAGGWCAGGRASGDDFVRRSSMNMTTPLHWCNKMSSTEFWGLTEQEWDMQVGGTLSDEEFDAMKTKIVNDFKKMPDKVFTFNPFEAEDTPTSPAASSMENDNSGLADIGAVNSHSHEIERNYPFDVEEDPHVVVDNYETDEEAVEYTFADESASFSSDFTHSDLGDKDDVDERGPYSPCPTYADALTHASLHDFTPVEAISINSNDVREVPATRWHVEDGCPIQFLLTGGRNFHQTPLPYETHRVESQSISSESEEQDSDGWDSESMVMDLDSDDGDDIHDLEAPATTWKVGEGCPIEFLLSGGRSSRSTRERDCQVHPHVVSGEPKVKERGMESWSPIPPWMCQGVLYEEHRGWPHTCWVENSGQGPLIPWLLNKLKGEPEM